MVYKILFATSGLVFVSALVLTYIGIWTEGDVSTNCFMTAVANFGIGSLFIILGTYVYENRKIF